MSAESKTTGARDSAASLRGAEKVAILLLALGKARAAKLLQRFDAEDLKLLSRSVTDLRPVSAADLEVLVEEFGQKFSSGVNFVGTANEFRDLLSGLVPEEKPRSAVAGESPAKAEDPVWQQMSALKLGPLRTFLLNEHPQTVAFILSRIGSEAAAKAISSFPADYRAGLLCRMLGIRKVPDEVMGVVTARLAKELVTSPDSGSRAGIADILNRLDKKQCEALLQSLAEVRPDEAKALKGMLFSFDDVALLPPQARTTIFDQVPIERLVLALRGTDATFQAAILSALASRSRRMVEAELQTNGTVSARDIAEARRAIVETVLKMIAKGEIQLQAADDLDGIAQ
jgi:flagellar motor switch protein FliG